MLQQLRNRFRKPSSQPEPRGEHFGYDPYARQVKFFDALGSSHRAAGGEEWSLWIKADERADHYPAMDPRPQLSALLAQATAIDNPYLVVSGYVAVVLYLSGVITQGHLLEATEHGTPFTCVDIPNVRIDGQNVTVRVRCVAMDMEVTDERDIMLAKVRFNLAA